MKRIMKRIFLWNLYGLIIGTTFKTALSGESQTTENFKSPYYGYQLSCPFGYTVKDKSNRAPTGFWLTVEKGPAILELNIYEPGHSLRNEFDFTSTAQGVAVQYLGDGCDAVVQSATNIPTEGVKTVRVVAKVSQCSTGPESESRDDWPTENKTLYVVNISQGDDDKLLLLRPNAFPEGTILGIIRSIRLFEKVDAQRGAPVDAGFGVLHGQKNNDHSR